MGADPEAARSIIRAMRVAMAQWCLPCRRQQGGKLESPLASRVAASGPSPKNRTSKMEKQRRIL